jgi:hypothetical protein
MPTEFTIDTRWGVVISRGTGVFTQADYLGHMARMEAHPRFCSAFNQIVDCRGFSHMDLSGWQIEKLADKSVFGSRTRRAFVVSSELQHGLARMFATWREIKEAQQVMVFRAMDDAVSWLGLPPDFDPYAADESESAEPLS